jgi:hypothetical protein
MELSEPVVSRFVWKIEGRNFRIYAEHVAYLIPLFRPSRASGPYRGCESGCRRRLRLSSQAPRSEI